MILSDHSIKEAISDGHIEVSPFNKDQIQPASLDVRLGSEVVENLYGKTVNETRDGNIVFEPGVFYLGHTREEITLPNNIAAQLTGRSSVGRKGVTIHQTAGWIDPGFSGQIVFEIHNISTKAAIFEPGERIGQLVFFELDQPSTGYDGKYQDQQGVVGSK